MYYEHAPTEPAYEPSISDECVLSEIDNASIGFTSIMSDNSAMKRQLKMLEDLRKLDKGYNKTYRYFNKKRVPVEFYTTCIKPRYPIRNAITGVYQREYLVGTRDEDMFYKVANCADKCNNDQHVMFFDSPEQYERHFHVTVDQASKEKWLEKFNKERAKRV